MRASSDKYELNAMKTEEKNIRQENTEHSEHRHRHHRSDHHHKHHGKEHVNGGEKFKRKNISATKRRKIIEKVLFWLMCFIAVIVTLLVIYIYCIDN